MSATPTLSVVVTNFNGEHYLPGMMEALERTGYPFEEIIVSDDASTDGSRLLLRHRYPEVRVVTSDTNRGPAPTRNAGIDAARGELILLLDNDGYPFADAVPPMVEALVGDPTLAGVMPRVILRGDPPLVHCDGARTHFTGQMWLLNGHVTEQEAGDAPQTIHSLMGTAMMFRREAARRIDGFEGDYYFYYEDHDFGSRLCLAHGPLRSVPAARIDHLGGTKGLSFRKGRTYPMKRAFLTAKNRQLFVLRTLSGRSLLRLLPVLVLHEVAQVAFCAVRGWLEAWFQGARWNLTHLARTLRKRAHIQATRVVPDEEIIVTGPLPLHPGILPKGGIVLKGLRILEAVLARLLRLAALRIREPDAPQSPRN